MTPIVIATTAWLLAVACVASLCRSASRSDDRALLDSPDSAAGGTDRRAQAPYDELPTREPGGGIDHAVSASGPQERGRVGVLAYR
jgi:hypothetical protein